MDFGAPWRRVGLRPVQVPRKACCRVGGRLQIPKVEKYGLHRLHTPWCKTAGTRVPKTSEFIRTDFFTTDPDELDDFHYNQASVDECGDDPELLAWMLEYPIGHPCYEKGLEIRGFRPAFEDELA